MQQQIAEIAGVQREQALLVRGIELARAPERELVDLGFRHLFGRLAAIFPALDDREQGARRPAPRIQVRRLDHLLQQAQLIVGIEDREVGLEPDQLGVAAQQAGAERMEGAEPQALDALPEQPRDALDHLARRLVGEGHRERLVRPRPPGHQQVGKARGQHPGLAGAGAGEHQERPVVRLDRGALRRVERVEIVSCRARWRRQHVRLTGHGTPVVDSTGLPARAPQMGSFGRQRAPRCVIPRAPSTPTLAVQSASGARFERTGLTLTAGQRRATCDEAFAGAYPARGGPRCWRSSSATR